MSPKSILKKPNTAQVGMRKHVHYNMKLNYKRTPSVSGINNPSIKNIHESSYFSSQTTRPSVKNELKRPKKQLRVNEKARSGIMSKNPKDHVVVKQNLMTKNAVKFCLSRVFRSLTRGSVDRSILQNPTLIRHNYQAFLNQGYSDNGKFRKIFEKSNLK